MSAPPVVSAKYAYSSASTRKLRSSPKLLRKHCLVSGRGMYCPDPEPHVNKSNTYSYWL